MSDGEDVLAGRVYQLADGDSYAVWLVSNLHIMDSQWDLYKRGGLLVDCMMTLPFHIL